MNLTKGIYRDYFLREVNKTLVDKKIKVCGFIRKKRNHGTILFIDLADNSSNLQCIVSNENKYFDQIEKLSYESVVMFEGIVKERSKETINEKISTGHVELEITDFKILSQAQELPFAIHQEDLNEELQMKYRFLYLRRNDMQKSLKLRTQVIDLLRKYMKELDFQEIQTPILSNSSPEGARDYIVPSRLNPGKFYALPQAPQQFKQLLIASGVERYFQIAPCFRDEDSRADRLLGEFYQLDFEMAYADQEDVFKVLEYVLVKLFSEIRPDRTVKENFPRITYKEAIEKYGSDKPDLRNPLELKEITEICNVPNIFKSAVENGAKMIIITANVENPSNKFFNNMQEFMQKNGASGLAWTFINNEKWQGPLNNMFEDEFKSNLLPKEHNAIFMLVDLPENIYKLASILRTELGNLLNLINKDSYEFCLITDFPMFEKNENKWDFMHNPFSMPQSSLETDDIGSITSYQYDIVCNGYELSSGAVRNHDLNLIKKAFEITGDNSADLEERFPLFKAFRYGIPPHAGAAPGIDRIIMLLNDKNDVRNTVPFPLNQHGENLLMNCPSFIDEKLLKELGINPTKEVSK